MTRSFVVACAAMAALVSHASGTKELYDGDNLAKVVADEAAYDEIILHKGTYSITSTVVVTNKMVIRGADGTTPDEVVLQGNKTYTLVRLGFAGSLLSGVKLTGGSLNGTSTTDYKYGAAVDVTSASVVSNCVITGNVLPNKFSAGIVALRSSNAVLTHCCITGNTFDRDVQYGGVIGLAVHCTGTVYVRNTLIDDNEQTVTTTQGNGGMIGGPAGATIWVVNCTLANNRVKGGSASIQCYGAGTANVVNTIVVGNTKNGVANIGSANGWYNCLTDVTIPSADKRVISNCEVTDTQIFADYASGDYRLTKNSTAAVDKGTQTAGKTAVAVEATDLADNDRIMGEEVDIGCYEFDPNERSVVFTVSPDGGTEPVDLTFEATPNGLGDTPTYYWDFDGDGAADYITTEATFTRTFSRGEYPITLYASNLTANVGASYARAEPMVIEQGAAFNPYETDWFFEPFAEPIKVTLSGDLGDAPKFYWDWDGDGVTDVVTDEPELKHTFAAGTYPITVFASNETTGVGIQVAMDEPLTVLVRPRVTVTASDPEVGITAADIQATIDAAVRGSIVTIPKGSYDINGTPIKVVKEIELRGATGVPKDVLLLNSANHHRIMNVDGGTHCLIHSLTLANGKGSKKANDAFEFVSGLMIASESGFEGVSNSRGTGATKGGSVSNVVVRGCSCGGNYGDPSTVYIKGPKARFTHSVISNNSATVTWAGNMFNTLALFVCGGAKADNLLVCNNTCTVSGSSYPSWLTVPVTVNGAGSVLRFSTIVNNVGGLCGGVNVYDGGRFEQCVIAGGRAFEGGSESRRNVWTSYDCAESGRITNSDDGRSAARETEATRAAKESIYSVQTNNAVDVAGCLNETAVYATTDELKPVYRKGAWRLPKGSPAIDVVPAKDVSGMPEKDLNGNRRLVNTLYDLGAFELPNPCGLMLLVK